MLPKKNRLTKKRDFEIVFKSGTSKRVGLLACKILGNNLPESRFGFVVSKKVSNRANVRNLVKRRLRKAVADILKSTQGYFDVVVVALPGIEKKGFSEIQKMVSDFLS